MSENRQGATSALYAGGARTDMRNILALHVYARTFEVAWQTAHPKPEG